jgi:chorismate mutase-like protein
MTTVVADPEWRWWIVWYFYLGGVAAGSYFLATLIALIGSPEDRRVSRTGYLLAAPLVAICGVLLIADLHEPRRFWHMLVHPDTWRPQVKFWSPMSMGAWALAVFGLLSTVSFVGAAAEIGFIGRGRYREKARRLHASALGLVLHLIGTAAGFFVASYTGVLLSASNQPVWSDSPWIGAMFLASSASTGGALLGYAAGRRGTQGLVERLHQIEHWSAALELAAIAAFFVSLRTAGSTVWAGPTLLLATVTVPFGIVLPAWLRGHGRLLGSATPGAACVLVLAGGFVLRVAVLDARDVLPSQRDGHQALAEPARRSEARPLAGADELWALVRERLQLMEQVAQAKWHASKAIDDATREQSLIRAARDAAVPCGVDPGLAEQFFHLQIEAAKQVQGMWLAEWSTRGPPAGPPPDLQLELRPRLDQLNHRLLAALHRCQTEAQTPRDLGELREKGQRVLAGLRIPESARSKLVEGVVQLLRESRQAPHAAP